MLRRTGTVDVDMRRAVATSIRVNVGGEVVIEGDVAQEDVEQLAAAPCLRKRGGVGRRTQGTSSAGCSLPAAPVRVVRRGAKVSSS